MSEEEVQADEVEELEETSDEELWEEESEEAEEESTEEDTPPEEESESVEEDEEAEEQEPDPKHNYEARYKDLEKEFHKRNEESARLRDDINNLRLRDVEREQTLGRVKQGLSEKKAPPVDPSNADSFFDKADKDTMEEFSELSSTFKKMIQHEMAKQGSTVREATVQAQERLKYLEDQNKESNYQQFLSYHEKYMVQNVGEDYRDIDKDPDFQAFVLGSPAMTKMMTESTDPVDHSSVMALFLSTQAGENAWRPSEEEPEKAVPKASAKRQAKRAAATGLLGNSAPVKTRNTDTMSDEELWEVIPD